MNLPQQMAKASVRFNYHQHSGDDILPDDIWSQKARYRMSTARERKSLTFTQMSSEAAMAMEQLTKTTSGKSQTSGAKSKKKASSRQLGNKNQSSSRLESRMQDVKPVCSVKLSDVYEKLGVEQKLDGDITDPTTWDESANKFVLGGGKMENAMEIVEIVNADDPKPADAHTGAEDEHAIAEIARINSINKCNVWFEAHESLLEETTPNNSQQEFDKASKHT